MIKRLEHAFLTSSCKQNSIDYYSEKVLSVLPKAYGYCVRAYVPKHDFIMGRKVKGGLHKVVKQILPQLLAGKSI